MPIEVAIWRLSNEVTRIEYTSMDTENRLEQVLTDDITIADPSLLLIGRQVPTSYGTFVDLLALDADGNTVVLELKRKRTPREVVAQLLDYGSWVRTLNDEDIAVIFNEFASKYGRNRSGQSLDSVFCERFQVREMPENLNSSHKLVVVAGELDVGTERIILYLAEEHGVAINAVFFRFFRDGDREYLSRAWLTDPGAIEAKVEEKRELPWNGEFYVSFGASANRDWEEARRFGFISAGGGSWYTKSLGMLEPGARIWVNIPGGVGYVGVGRVLEEVVPIDDFLVKSDEGKRIPITQLPVKAANHTTMAQDPEKAEHMVRVQWIKTVPTSAAVREKGFFGNQNSAAKPRVKRWLHTIQRLRTLFQIAD